MKRLFLIALLVSCDGLRSPEAAPTAARGSAFEFYVTDGGLGCASMWLSHADGAVHLRTACPLYGVDVKSFWVDGVQVWAR